MTDKVFEFIEHPSGIYGLMFYESSREAVDASVAALNTILAARPSHDTSPLLLLSDNSISGDEPIAYAASAYRGLMSDHGREKMGNIYLAMVHTPSALMSFWVTLFSTFRLGIRVKTFPVSRRDEAIAWLESVAETHAA